jgi:4-oxalocrotonate tautomerase
MPFINVQIVEGHAQERKDEIARRITEAVTDVTKLPKEFVWVVFEEVSADKWYIGATSVSAARRQAG